jgi:hypothetical protein
MLQLVVSFCFFIGGLSFQLPATTANYNYQLNVTWTQQSNGPFSPREGLMAVAYEGQLIMSGGRDKFGVGFSDEVWLSLDTGVTWELVASKQVRRLKISIFSHNRFQQHFPFKIVPCAGVPCYASG